MVRSRWGNLIQYSRCTGAQSVFLEKYSKRYQWIFGCNRIYSGSNILTGIWWLNWGFCEVIVSPGINRLISIQAKNRASDLELTVSWRLADRDLTVRLRWVGRKLTLSCPWAGRDPYLTFKISSRHYVIYCNHMVFKVNHVVQGQSLGSGSTTGSSSKKPTLYSHFYDVNITAGHHFGRAKDDSFYSRVCVCVFVNFLHICIITWK
jgi:hypothetical protein